MPMACRLEGIPVPMTACTIELTPSMSGWHYAASTVGAAPRIRNDRETCEQPVPDNVQEVSPVCIGYGPEGRPRLTTPRAGLWLFA